MREGQVYGRTDDQRLSLIEVLENSTGDFLLTEQGDGSLIVGTERGTVEITTAGTVLADND